MKGLDEWADGLVAAAAAAMQGLRAPKGPHFFGLRSAASMRAGALHRYAKV